jgi:ribonuclease HI
MLFLFCDSAIEPFNPFGLLTWAFIAKQDNKLLYQEAGLVGWGKGMTNNKGEYMAVIAALRWLITQPKAKWQPAVVSSDSELIVKQINGMYGCRDEELFKLLSLVNKVKAQYHKHITFRWIPRENNTEADALSRTPYIGKEKAIEILKSRHNELIYGDDDIPF